MVQMSTIVMASLIFCMGLILGLVCHLPGVSSPHGHSQDQLEQQSSLLRTRRNVFQPNNNISTQARNPKVNTNVIASKTPTFQSDSIHEDTLSEVSLDEINVNDLRADTKHWRDSDMKTDSLGGISPLSVSQNTNSNQHSSGIPSVSNTNKLNVQSQTDTLIVTNSLRPNVTRTVQVKVANGPVADAKLTPDATKTVAKTSPPAQDEQLPRSSSHLGEDSLNGQGYIVDGIYWSKEAESLAPKGFTGQQIEEWRRSMDNNKVISLTQGCGRMQNRQLILNDATKACARYRQNTDQIQGEIYSYYLSRVLGMSHVPPSVLVQPNPRSDQWRKVHSSLATAQWSADKVVIVTPWVSGLEPAFIPEEFQKASRQLHPTDLADQKSPDQIQTLLQWSDLIVFDYLTANLDRVVNNMYNQQWNPDMMNSAAHNLERDPKTGLLVFLDNESGLFHSYRLLDKYNHYHQELLKSLCVFRKSTVDSIRAFVDNGDIGATIMSLFKSEEPLHKYVPRIPDKTTAILNQRLRDVSAQIASCQSRYVS